MSEEQITLIINYAKDKFLSKDLLLLTLDVNERSITHKFAEYLQQEMGDEWNVDCEYNRDYEAIKTINPRLVNLYENEEVSVYDTDTKTIYPDIIIHKRNSDNNLLVIEAKKSNAGRSSITKDKIKLQLIKEQFIYEHAVFMLFDTGNEDIQYEFI